jgi:hypothetical protein
MNYVQNTIKTSHKVIIIHQNDRYLKQSVNNVQLKTVFYPATARQRDSLDNFNHPTSFSN